MTMNKAEMKYICHHVGISIGLIKDCDEKVRGFSEMIFFEKPF
jgi:hypothetical protein